MLKAPSPMTAMAGCVGSATTAPSTPVEAEPISAKPGMMNHDPGRLIVMYGLGVRDRVADVDEDAAAVAIASPTSCIRRAGWIGIRTRC